MCGLKKGIDPFPNQLGSVSRPGNDRAQVGPERVQSIERMDLMKGQSPSPNASPQGPHLKYVNSLEEGFIGRDCLGSLSQSQHG